MLVARGQWACQGSLWDHGRQMCQGAHHLEGVGGAVAVHRAASGCCAQAGCRSPVMRRHREVQPLSLPLDEGRQPGLVRARGHAAVLERALLAHATATPVVFTCQQYHQVHLTATMPASAPHSQ